LDPLASDAPSAMTAPPAFFSWIVKKHALPYPHYLSVPLYRGVDRSRVLFEVQLPLGAGDDQADWILAGVALYVSD